MVICECLPDSFQIVALMLGMSFPSMYQFGPFIPWYLKFPLYAFWTAAYPFICVADEVHIMAHEKRDGYRRIQALPKSIHPRWRRREAISITRGGKRRQSDECGLLKLPREVRDMIWREVLGGETIYLNTRERRLRGKMCLENNPNCQAICDVSSRKQRLLGIVGTCSRM